MSDKKFSVDDILGEVAARRKSGSSESTSSFTNTRKESRNTDSFSDIFDKLPKKEETPSYAKTEEIPVYTKKEESSVYTKEEVPPAVSDMKNILHSIDTEINTDFIKKNETVKAEKTINEAKQEPVVSPEEVINDFLKAEETDFSEDTDLAKQKVDFLYEEVKKEEISDKTITFKLDPEKKETSFFKKKRAPHVLTKEEILTPNVSSQNDAVLDMFLSNSDSAISESSTTVIDKVGVKTQEEITEPEDISSIKPKRDMFAFFKKNDTSKQTEPEYEEDDDEDEEFSKLESNERDYQTIEDFHEIKNNLFDKFRGNILNFVVNIIFTLTLISLYVLPEMGISLVPAIKKSNDTIYIFTMTVLFAGMLLVNIKTIFSGITKIFKDIWNFESTLAICYLVGLLQLVCSFSNKNIIANSIYIAPVVGLITVFYNASTYAFLSRVKDNFNLVGNVDTKKSVFILDPETTAKVTKSGESELCIAADKSAVNLKGFLGHSFSLTPADKVSKIISVFSIVLAILTAAVLWFLNRNSTAISADTYAMNALAIIPAICAPVGCFIAANFPLMFSSKSINIDGGILSGYTAVEEFSGTTHVCIDASEMFPAGSVELLGIKTFGDTLIDDAILSSASLVIPTNGPLCEVFDKMIEGNKKILKNATEVTYKNGLGITGMVDGKEILVGNRDLMEKHLTCALPDLDSEKKLLENNRYPVYIASDNTLTAMFVVKYSVPDESLLSSVRDLVFSGVNIIIKSSDANITPDLVSKCFEIPEDSISIMNSYSVEVYDSATASSKNASAIFAHHNSFAAFAGGISACYNLSKTVLMSTVISAIFAGLSVIPTLYFLFTDKMNSITIQNILFFQLAVFTLITCISVFRKPK